MILKRHYSIVHHVLLVWASEKSALAILNQAFEDNLINPSFVWILTTTVTLQHFTLRQQQKLIGILAIEPVEGV